MKMGKLLYGILVLVLVVTAIVGCGSGADMGASEAPMAEEGMSTSSVAPGAPQPSAASQDDISLESVDRMIIYTGELSLVVQNAEAAMRQAIALAEGVDGYLSGANSNTYGNGLRRINLTLRVPAEAFNETMDALRQLALEVTQDAVVSEDVTQEYVDLASRLTALEVKAERLEELMDDAEDTEAVLAVYEELSETQMEIEETKGRMRYLERRSAMATITVYLTPDELAQPVEVAGWRPEGTAKRALEALIRSFQFLLDALIWIILGIVPVLGFIGLLVYILIRVLRALFGRRRKKEKAPSEAAADRGPAATE